MNQNISMELNFLITYLFVRFKSDFKNNIFFLQINIFHVSNHFNILILKIIFKK